MTTTQTNGHDVRRAMGMPGDFDSHLDSLANERFTVRELQEAFTMVQDQENWKNPVSALIHPRYRDVVADAVTFMTGSIPKFLNIGSDMLRVQAAGYYEAVGA